MVVAVQEGSPAAVCFAAALKKPLTDGTLLLNFYVVKRMLRVVYEVSHFMKYPPLHYQLSRLQNIPRTDPAFFISLFSFFKRLALMLL